MGENDTCSGVDIMRPSSFPYYLSLWTEVASPCDPSPSYPFPIPPYLPLLPLSALCLQLLNRLRVCTSRWTVLGLDQPLCGDVEMWEMEGWSASWNQTG